MSLTAVAIATMVSTCRRKTGRCMRQGSMLHSRRHSMKRPVSTILTSSISQALTPSICSSRVFMAYKSPIKSLKPMLPLKIAVISQVNIVMG